jgi:hypothetical protein
MAACFRGQKGNVNFNPRRRSMKLRIGCLIFVLCLLTLSMDAATCNQAILNGNYAASNIGSVAGAPGYGVMLFLETYDGVSKFTGTGVENVNGTVSTGVTLNGTYSVNAVGKNCTFYKIANDSLGNTISDFGTVDSKGGEMDGFSATDLTQMQFTAYKQKNTSCTEASAAGTFTEKIYRQDTPGGTVLVAAQLNVTSKGATMGSLVENYGGGAILRASFTGTTTMNSDCTFTTTTYSDGSAANFFGVGGLSENGVKRVMIGTDSGSVGLATLY